MTNNYVYNEEKKTSGSHRLFKIAILALFAILILSVPVLAYFSDNLTSETNVKAGTLQIEGDYSFSVNEDSDTSKAFKNLNPGDIIVIQVNVKNNGSKSAWIRDKIEFEGEALTPELLAYFEIYEGHLNADSFLNPEETPVPVALVDEQVGTWGLPAKVINGNETLEESELEDIGTDGVIGSDNYLRYITIRFSPLAGNDAQGLAFKIKITTQALQYRNNIAIPSEASWQTVVKYNG